MTHILFAFQLVLFFAIIMPFGVFFVWALDHAVHWSRRRQIITAISIIWLFGFVISWFAS